MRRPRPRVRRTDVEEPGTILPPLLVVEVRSPSTWRTDERRKREIYASTGVASYWLVDPVAQILRVLELQDGVYVETAHLEGADALELDRPFPVTVRPFPRA